MARKILIVAVALAGFALVVAGIFYFYPAGKKTSPTVVPPRSATPEDIQSQLNKRGEAMYRQRYYAPLIATYKGMLEKMPGNAGIKKQLAKAYIGAGEEDEARKILEGIDDPEAKEMLKGLK